MFILTIFLLLLSHFAYSFSKENYNTTSCEKGSRKCLLKNGYGSNYYTCVNGTKNIESCGKNRLCYMEHSDAEYINKKVECRLSYTNTDRLEGKINGFKILKSLQDQGNNEKNKNVNIDTFSKKLKQNQNSKRGFGETDTSKGVLDGSPSEKILDSLTLEKIANINKVLNNLRENQKPLPIISKCNPGAFTCVYHDGVSPNFYKCSENSINTFKTCDLGTFCYSYSPSEIICAPLGSDIGKIKDLIRAGNNKQKCDKSDPNCNNDQQNFILGNSVDNNNLNFIQNDNNANDNTEKNSMMNLVKDIMSRNYATQSSKVVYSSNPPTVLPTKTSTTKISYTTFSVLPTSVQPSSKTLRPSYQTVLPTVVSP
ncbi:hypothetical protein BB558_006209, partial [Smittium angustum]